MSLIALAWQWWQRHSRWRSVRTAHLAQEPACVACGSRQKPHVHHVVPVHLDPERELDPGNLVTLCAGHCHFVFGHLSDWRSWNPSVRADAAAYRRAVEARP
jgi:hypothetical protein